MEEIVSFRLVIATTVLSILSATAGRSDYGCPSVCTCYVDDFYGLRTANCSGVNFLSEHKYNKLFYEIEVLNLVTENDDDPTRLWDEMFLPFIKLKQLNLSKCKIYHLPKNVFKGLKKVYDIDLSYNYIKNFDNSVFENIYTLFKLNLRGNPLQSSYKPFISSTSLRELDLGYCGMTVLQNEFFHSVKKVARLHLDGNHIQTIKEHVLPRGITHLNLASNRIVNVPINTINSLSQLRWINLGANPVNCTCSLLNLQDRLSGRGIIIDGDVRCAYPLDLENIGLSKVNENELCNKETFRSSYHYKKSQSTKYIHSQKKDRYFENEKNNPLESFQGDDPGKSTDEFTDYDNLLSEEGYDEPKESKITGESDNDNQGDVLKDNTAEVKDENAKETSVDEVKKNIPGSETTVIPTNSKEEQSQDVIEDENKDNIESNTEKPIPETELISSDTDNTKKLEELSSPSERHQEDQPVIGTEQASATNDQLSDVIKETEGETTLPPMTTDADLIGVDPGTVEKSNLDTLNEGLKRLDEIIPVAESHNEASDTVTDTKDHDVHESDGHSKSSQENHVIGDNKLEDNADNRDDIEASLVAKNQSQSFSENSNKDHQELHTEHTEQENQESELSNHEKEETLHEENILANVGKDESAVYGNSTEIHISSTVSTIAANEEEGSGDDFSEISEGNFSVPVIDDVKDISQDTTLPPSSETPIIINTDDNSVKTHEPLHINNENTQEIIDKESNTYEAMGPYIVAAGIIILITILVIVSIYKGLCKSKKDNRKPVVADIERNNGTELQDMKSLLPQTPITDEKHNSKYPNEVPSPETVNLIKEDKTDDAPDSNGTHDLNQNDSKNEPVIKNGKAPEGSPPPIEITKAKLTVLHESIPRTPIFVQKRPAVINNG